MDISEYLKFNLGGRFGLIEKRPSIAQVVLPRYYEDGDMLDVFIDLPKQNGDPLVISDHGCTFMRLSCFCEPGALVSEEAFSQALSAHGVEVQGDVLRMDTKPEDLYADLERFAQAIEEVSAMRQQETAAEGEAASAA